MEKQARTGPAGACGTRYGTGLLHSPLASPLIQRHRAWFRPTIPQPPWTGHPLVPVQLQPSTPVLIWPLSPLAPRPAAARPAQRRPLPACQPQQQPAHPSAVSWLAWPAVRRSRPRCTSCAACRVQTPEADISTLFSSAVSTASPSSGPELPPPAETGPRSTGDPRALAVDERSPTLTWLHTHHKPSADRAPPHHASSSRTCIAYLGQPLCPNTHTPLHCTPVTVPLSPSSYISTNYCPIHISFSHQLTGDLPSFILDLQQPNLDLDFDLDLDSSLCTHQHSQALLDPAIRLFNSVIIGVEEQTNDLNAA